MKVCFFGTYESGHYTIILKNILESQGIEVVECQVDVKRFSSLISGYWRLFLKNRNLTYDVMIIPWRGIISFPLAKIISKGPIIHFPFLSIHDVLVLERKKIKSNSFKAKFVFFVDKMACNLADMVIMDSDSHLEHFLKKFNLKRRKLRTLFLGTDETNFFPQKLEKKESKFIVLYFGSFVPPHGIDFILKAANLLKNEHDIVFRFCGDGYLKKDLEKMAKSLELSNVEFLGYVPLEILQENIRNCDVCLGGFGNSEKAKNATFLKTYSILASQRALITMDCNGMRSIYGVNNKNCIMISNSNPKNLSDAILSLKQNPTKVKELAIEGRKTYEKYFTNEKIGEKLKECINELI